MLLQTLLFSILIGSPQLERPHITIAQGYIESGMNVYAVGSRKEKGAWQVQEKHWGKVPGDLKGQAEQSERILNELLKSSSGDICVALARYNGRGTQALQYVRKVRKMAFEIALFRA